MNCDLLSVILSLQFGPNFAEKRRWMGPVGHLCHIDNALQDGDSAGAVEAANSHRHLAPHARPRHPLTMFAISNPATEEEDNDDPGWSTSETYGSH